MSSEYGPRGRLVIRYAPVSLLDTVRVKDVAVLRAVIFASGITAPLLSWTTPKRVAVVVWPLAIQSGQHSVSAMARRDRLIGKLEQLRRLGIDPSGSNRTL